MSRKRDPVMRENGSASLLRGVGVACLLALSVAACEGVGPFEPEGESVELPGRITLTPPEPVLFAIGAREELTIVLDGELQLGTEQVEWSSSAPGIARIDEEGIVTAMSDGVATITARWEGLTARATVTVAATFTNVARITAMNQSDPNDSNDEIAVSVTVSVAP